MCLDLVQAFQVAAEAVSLIALIEERIELLACDSSAAFQRE